MVTVAKNALAANPTIENVLLFETAPRYDAKHKLNQYAQEKLMEAKINASDDRFIIGKHSLACKDGLRVSRVAYTRSVAKVLAEVGLITSEEAANMSRNKLIKFNKEGEGWSKINGKQSRASRPVEQLTTFQLATQNRFGPLQPEQGNY